MKLGKNGQKWTKSGYFGVFWDFGGWRKVENLELKSGKSVSLQVCSFFIEYQGTDFLDPGLGAEIRIWRGEGGGRGVWEDVEIWGKK